MGERRRLTDKLHSLLVARLVAAFAEAGQQIPPGLKNNSLTASALDNRLRALGNLQPHVYISTSSLDAWRVAREKAEGENATAREAAGTSGKRARTG